MSFSTASLRAKLLSAILVAALLPLVLATTLAVGRTRSAVREQVGAARAEMATQLAGWLERVMLERTLELRGAAASGEIAAAALGFGDSTTTKNALAALLSRSGLLRSASLYNVQGAVVSWSGTPPDASGSQGISAIIAAKSTNVASVSRDPSGRVVVRIAHPVTTTAGAAGVLVADVDWEGLMTTALGSLERRAAQGGTAAIRAYVVEASGTVIGSTKRDEIMTAKVGAESLIKALHSDSSGSQVVDLFGGPASLVGFAPLSGGEAGSERFVAVGNAGTHVVIAEPTSAAFAAAMALQWVLIAVSVGVGVLAAFVAHWTAVRFTKPISDATASAERLAVGDTEHQIVPLNSNDELGRLNASLRGLHDYLRELTAAAHRVAAGDLAVVVSPKSERDDLSRAFATVVGVNVQVVSELADMTRRAAEGDLTALVMQVATARSPTASMER
jgi:HAMP domain-containing protein